MEEKWFGITMCVFFVCAFGSVVYEEHTKELNRCRVAYAQTQWSVEDINKVCK